MALQGVRGSVDFANPQPASPGPGGQQPCHPLQRSLPPAMRWCALPSQEHALRK
ncbi:hypothetical protein ACFOGG_05000 [Brenneria rubrifaciens]|uniref:hypothetical protein n=1 Tax=Brenneria rubrifaciens TaxID=55213 RepID=UPI003619EF10